MNNPHHYLYIIIAHILILRSRSNLAFDMYEICYNLWININFIFIQNIIESFGEFVDSLFFLVQKKCL